MKSSHYFDHNATTRVMPSTLDAMREAFNNAYANASSVHDHGVQASYAVEQSRQRIAEHLRVAPEQLFFTSGGTEADNLAVHAALASHREGPAIFSRIEHPAVKEPAEFWCERYQREAIWLEAQESGHVRVSDFDRPAALMAVMLANNESGVIQPVAEVADLARKHGAWMHCDAVQALGKIPVDLTSLGIDSAAMSAHKFYGPKGIGMLYLRNPEGCPPIVRGGSQEKGVRPGTINVQGCVGMAAALDACVAVMGQEAERLKGLRASLIRVLSEAGARFEVNGDIEDALPNTLNLQLVGCNAKETVRQLGDQGFAVSAGAACSSQAVKVIASAVLMAMGLGEERALESIRITMGHDTDDEAVEALGKAMIALQSQLV